MLPDWTLAVTDRTILIKREMLAAFVASIFVTKGMRPEDAACLADVLVWADARGVDSHGIARLPMYLRFIDTGAMDPRAMPEIRDCGSSLFVVEARRSAGAVAMRSVVDESLARARLHGCAIGIARGTTHTGGIGYYVERAAQAGLAAIDFNGGPPNMAYHGARVASLATAPIAIGVPSSEGPLVLDMATASIANGRLKLARSTGGTLPPGSALTHDGKPTTVASEAELLLPLGGAKGSGLAFMIEVLTGVTVANPLLSMMLGPAGKRSNAHNAMFIAIDIERLRPLADFTADVDALARIIRDLPRLDPQQPILLPGERGRRQDARSKQSGVCIPFEIWAATCSAAAQLGITPPGNITESLPA